MYSKGMRKARRRDARKIARAAKTENKRKGLGTYAGGGTWVPHEEMVESLQYGMDD